MVIAICYEVVLQTQTFEVLRRTICYLAAGFDLLHHAMHDRGLATTPARHDYCAAIELCSGTRTCRKSTGDRLQNFTVVLRERK